MPTVLRKRRISNPGRVTLKKGSQAARDFMAKLRGKRKSAGTRRVTRAKKRVNRNIGELVTISLGNPEGEKKSMAIRRRTRKARRNPVVMANPRRRRQIGARRNPRRIVRRFRSRRNPDVKGTFSQVGGVLGGAVATGILSGMVNSAMPTSGAINLLVTAGVAFAQGTLAGNFFKNKQLGDSMVIGGLTVVALQVINQFMPQASGILPIGLKGLGHTYVDAKTLPPPMVGKSWLNYPMNATYGSAMPLAALPAGGVKGARW